MTILQSSLVGPGLVSLRASSRSHEVDHAFGASLQRTHTFRWISRPVEKAGKASKGYFTQFSNLKWKRLRYSFRLSFSSREEYANVQCVAVEQVSLAKEAAYHGLRGTYP